MYGRFWVFTEDLRKLDYLPCVREAIPH
jgi:hypothetical protein